MHPTVLYAAAVPEDASIEELRANIARLKARVEGPDASAAAKRAADTPVTTFNVSTAALSLLRGSTALAGTVRHRAASY